MKLKEYDGHDGEWIQEHRKFGKVSRPDAVLIKGRHVSLCEPGSIVEHVFHHGSFGILLSRTHDRYYVMWSNI